MAYFGYVLIYNTTRRQASGELWRSKGHWDITPKYVNLPVGSCSVVRTCSGLVRTAPGGYTPGGILAMPDSRRALIAAKNDAFYQLERAEPPMQATGTQRPMSGELAGATRRARSSIPPSLRGMAGTGVTW